MKIARTLALAASIASSPLFPVAGAILALPAFGAAAQQVKAIDPTWAMVERPAVVHSGDSQRYYRVAELQPGTLVRVDGESTEWARISYPAGLGAFVRADAVKQGETPESLVLTTSSRLYAANAVAGFDGSWKALLAESQALPGGTTLKALETVRSGAGAVVGYKVAAPDAARGFVLRTNLRNPTPEELAAAGATTAAPTAATTPASPPTTTPSEGTGQPATSTDVVTLTTPPAEGGTPPPVSTNTEGEGPVMIEQKSVVITPAAPAPGSLQALDESFKRVQAQPDSSAEIDELKAELQAALDKLEDTPQNRMTRAGLQQRIEILSIRADLRDRLRAMEERRAAATVASGASAEAINTLEKNRVYTITGKLMTSELYDGTRLPRMLRVQSVGGATSRTLGYIKPDPALSLDAKIGQTVGVVGNIILDPKTGLRTIEASKVEVLANVPTDARTPGVN
jgi:hypothetical protein